MYLSKYKHMRPCVGFHIRKNFGDSVMEVDSF